MDAVGRDRRTSSATEYDPILNRIRAASYTGVTSNNHSVNTKTSSGQWRVYRRRWYILLLFSLVCFDQSVVLNTWAPISDSAKLVFGWTDGDISLLSNWGSITFVSLALVGPWVIQTLGLRLTMIGTAVLVLAGSGLRCITTRTPAATWLIHTGQFLDGLAGIITMAAPPVVSSVWFPPEQRTLATDPCFINMNAEQILRLMYIVSLYVSIILSGLFVNGAVPLFYEMAAEITFPIPEAISSTVLVWSNCFFAGIFLLIPMIPGVGTLWMTWSILGAFLLSLPLLLFLRGNYRRLRVDQGQPDPA
uniref:Major facilitator superfamily (MFS) profile domain-containing protein n=1 Tax=Branchiostoma floridae TaxID=7739 RepID=C3YB84_BRAFL|eukprot:XP_002606231.1 hypothetical protein BRAFLDRAFT_84029 [Branchiostoma floridae]